MMADPKRAHERLTHTAQRHAYQTIATALRLLHEDHQRDPDGPSSVGATAEPVLRGVEDTLDLNGDERTTESFEADPHADDECEVCGTEPDPDHDRTFLPMPSTDGGVLCDSCLHKARIAHAVSEKNDEPAFAVGIDPEKFDVDSVTGELAESGEE